MKKRTPNLIGRARLLSSPSPISSSSSVASDPLLLLAPAPYGRHLIRSRRRRREVGCEVRFGRGLFGCGRRTRRLQMPVFSATSLFEMPLFISLAGIAASIRAAINFSEELIVLELF